MSPESQQPEQTTARSHMRHPLSFVRRSNRLTPRRQRAWDTALGQELLDIPHGDRDTSVADDFRIDWKAEFGRDAELIVEIGTGSGEAVAHAAAEAPEKNFLAVEVYKPGVAQLVSRLRREGLRNVRVANVDATDVLDKLLPEDSVSELWVFFPDPWHKTRHHKRRLVSPDFARLAARVIRPGGLWRLATDWEEYALVMREVLEASEDFRNEHPGRGATEDDPTGGWAPRWEGRVLTSFERKAGEAGRHPWDLTYRRL